MTIKNKRKINYLVVHCTASHQTQTIDEIKAYWRNSLGWNNPGYHYIIRPDGAVVQLHPEHLPSNGVAGYNSQCINISYIGGIDKNIQPIDNRTDAQKTALISILKELKHRYPKAKIQGHRDFKGVNKACPCFNAIEEYKSL